MGEWEGRYTVTFPAPRNPTVVNYQHIATSVLHCETLVWKDISGDLFHGSRLSQVRRRVEEGGSHMSNDRDVTDPRTPAEGNHESFLRWQHVTITQLGSSIRLFLTFATASLGFLRRSTPAMDGMSPPSNRTGFRRDTTTTAHRPGSRQSNGSRRLVLGAKKRSRSKRTDNGRGRSRCERVSQYGW